MIQKLNLTVRAGDKAKAYDFNRVSGKVDEIIGSMSTPTYYAECTSMANEQYKNVSLDSFMFDAGGHLPVDGCMMVVKMVNGNTAEGMNLKVNTAGYSSPVYYGSEPVQSDVIPAGTMMTVVYDASDERWYITAGLSEPLPALYLTTYTLKNIIAGRYTDQSILSDMYAKIVGTATKKVFEGNQICMLYNKSYIPISLVEDDAAYTFEFLYGSKHYAFRMYQKADSTYALDVTDNGSNIITHWEQ